MFDLGWTELLVIAVVAILVVGPKDLPQMLRTLGQFAAKMRSMAREFQRQFEEAARDTGLDDVRKGISSVRDVASPSKHVKEAFNSIADETKSIKASVEGSGSGTAAQATSGSAAGTAAAATATAAAATSAPASASTSAGGKKTAGKTAAKPATAKKASSAKAPSKTSAAKPAARRSKPKPAATTES